MKTMSSFQLLYIACAAHPATIKISQKAQDTQERQEVFALDRPAQNKCAQHGRPSPEKLAAAIRTWPAFIPRRERLD